MSEYKRTIPAISLVSDPSVLTSLSNDYGFEEVFSKQISALGNKDDMAIAISTSGNSQNCVNAINTARDKGLVTSALLGGEGGKLVSLVEYPLVVPSNNTQRIQEMHILIIHIICQIIKGWAKEVDFRP
jgi:D-sedoheptulose 7-phosphate isomerase